MHCPRLACLFAILVVGAAQRLRELGEFLRQLRGQSADFRSL